MYQLHGVLMKCRCRHGRKFTPFLIDSGSGRDTKQKENWKGRSRCFSRQDESVNSSLLFVFVPMYARSNGLFFLTLHEPTIKRPLDPNPAGLCVEDISASWP
jgi:hypothetical protein